MRTCARFLLYLILLISGGITSNAFACSIAAWDGTPSNIPGNGTVGSPKTVSRVSELCGLVVTGQAYVQSNHASNDSHYIARFYVFPQVSGSGTVDLLIGYLDESGASPIFGVSFDGANFVFDAGDGTPSSTAAASGWNLVEFEYNDESGTFNYWVNETWNFNAGSYTSGPTGTFSFTPGAGAVESVRVGAPGGFASQVGKISFDTFESHRTTNVGDLRIGDANGSGSVSVQDYGAVQAEILGTLQIGQPDCNLDGSVSVQDYGCVQGVILGGG